MLEPRTRITSSGYIRAVSSMISSAAILLGYGKYLKEEDVDTERRIYVHFTMYEEVGHGGSASVPEGVTEAWSWTWAVWGKAWSVQSTRYPSVQRMAEARGY